MSFAVSEWIYIFSAVCPRRPSWVRSASPIVRTRLSTALFLSSFHSANFFYPSSNRAAHRWLRNGWERGRTFEAQNAGMTVHDLLRPGSLNNLTTKKKDVLQVCRKNTQKQHVNLYIKLYNIQENTKTNYI